MPSKGVLFRLIRAAFLGSIIIKAASNSKKNVKIKVKKTSREDILDISVKNKKKKKKIRMFYD